MKADRPIDAMIAEHVMNTEKYWSIRWGGSGYGDFPTYDEAVIHALKLFGDRRAMIIPYWDEPHYSTDISAAWQVVEKLIADHWEPAIDFEKQRGQWCAEFSDGTIIMRSFADTATLAICLAALKAVGVEVEQSQIGPKE